MTVTSVETSPDLRSARVYVSVLGDEEEREATLAGLRSSHGVLQSAIAARDADEADPDPDLPLRRHARAGRPHLAGCSTRSERGRGGGSARTRRSSASPRSCAPRDRFLLTTHEGPDGDALGSLLAMHTSSRSSARTR